MPKVKLDHDIKAAWLHALRSGEYPQTQSVLRNEHGFCCLGVLCDVYTQTDDKGRWIGVDGLRTDFAYVYAGETYLRSLPPPLLADINANDQASDGDGLAVCWDDLSEATQDLIHAYHRNAEHTRMWIWEDEVVTLPELNDLCGYPFSLIAAVVEDAF